ncbi:MAG: YigZ family protein [Clostridia bacterium]|nr:YigZ family protein [Clostridia bacterium]
MASPIFFVVGESMEYRTIGCEASDEFIERKSRFIGYVKPVTTQEDAVTFINEIKSKHWDATHNVYAYVLRDGQVRRYSDDGEPQGTAGIPVLDVLLKENVTDCVVVATRYFGGTLLGAGGLVRAYSHTAKIALEAGGIVTMKLCKVLQCTCDYNFYGRLNSLVPEMGGAITDSDFAENVTVTFDMPVDIVPQFEAKLVDMSFGKFHSEEITEKYKIL